MRSWLTAICCLAGVFAVARGYAQVIPENTAVACQDGVDNDGDGFHDCADQDCSFFVFCQQAHPGAGAAGTYPSQARPGPHPATARKPVVANHGKGLFLAGAVMGGLGLVSMIAGTGLAWQNYPDFEDEQLGPSVGPFVGGFALDIVGGGLLLGAQARPLRSLRGMGQPAGYGFLIGSSVLYGVNIILFGVMATLGPVLGGSPAPYFSVSTSMTLLTLVVCAAGWKVANGRLHQALGTQAEAAAGRTWVAVPFLSPISNGALAGVAAAF
jgi:hypothetical protein